MATKEEVEAFLHQLQDKIRFFDVAFRPRDKNIVAIAELDILPYDRLEYLKNLSVENYMDGPKRDTFDHSKPAYFEFGVNVKGTDVYIKVSLGLPNKRVDCMSFHKAERPMTYQYKNETE